MSLTVGYTRLSNDKDGTGLGVARQREDIAALAHQLGWSPVVEFYEDNDLTADPRRAFRPAFHRLLGDMRSGRVTHVLCYDQDRLARDMRELEDIVDAVEVGDVMLTSVNGDIDLRTDNGRLVARIKGAVARNELEKLSRRIRRKMLQRAEMGIKHQSRHRIFGYERNWTVVPEEAAVIVEMFRQKAAGESLQAITRHLVETGTQPTGGGRWDHVKVMRILTRPDYVGDIAYKGEVVGKARFEPIIERATFEQAGQRIRESSRSRPDSGFLRGLVVCATCKSLMVPRVEGGLTYKCRQTSVGHCGSNSISAAYTDPLVFEAALVKELEQSSLPPEVRAAALERRRVQSEIDQALAVHRDGRLALLDLVPILESLRDRLSRALPQHMPRQGDAAELLPFRSDWDNWSLSRQRSWLAQHVALVEVSKSATRTGGFRPERVTIHFLDGEVRRLVVDHLPSPR